MCEGGFDFHYLEECTSSFTLFLFFSKKIDSFFYFPSKTFTIFPYCFLLTFQVRRRKALQRAKLAAKRLQAWWRSVAVRLVVRWQWPTAAVTLQRILGRGCVARWLVWRLWDGHARRLQRVWRAHVDRQRWQVRTCVCVPAIKRGRTCRRIARITLATCVLLFFHLHVCVCYEYNSKLVIYLCTLFYFRDRGLYFMLIK